MKKGQHFFCDNNVKYATNMTEKYHFKVTTYNKCQRICKKIRNMYNKTKTIEQIKK